MSENPLLETEITPEMIARGVDEAIRSVGVYLPWTKSQVEILVKDIVRAVLGKVVVDTRAAKGD